MENFDYCSFCELRSDQLKLFTCGHELVCQSCANMRKGVCNTCGCIETFNGNLLIFCSSFYKKDDFLRNEQRVVSNSVRYEELKPSYLKFIYRSLWDSFDKRQEILKIYTNLLQTGLCSKCFTNQVNFISLIEMRGFCSACKTHSSILVQTQFFTKHIEKMKDKASECLSIFLLGKLQAILREESDNYKVFTHLHIMIEYGGLVDGFLKYCSACFTSFDYKNFIPMIYSCKFKSKHVICSQCYLSSKKICPFDKQEINNLRIYHEIIEKVKCAQNCGYRGVIYYKYNFTELICENCYTSNKKQDKSQESIKKALMFFNLLCKKHRRIAIFFNLNSFEALCYYCSNENSIEISPSSTVELIQDKENWIKNVLYAELNQNQRKIVDSMNFDKFFSLSERYEQIKRLENRLNEFWFNEGLVLNSYKQVNLMKGLNKVYNETIEFKVDKKLKVLAVIYQMYPEIEEICIDLMKLDEKGIDFVWRKVVNCRENAKKEVSRVDIEEKVVVLPGADYRMIVAFRVTEDFIVYKRAKKSKGDKLVQNRINFWFKIMSVHNRRILVQGLSLKNEDS